MSDLTGVVREASRRLSESDSISLKFKIFLRGLIEKNPDRSLPVVFGL